MSLRTIGQTLSEDAHCRRNTTKHTMNVFVACFSPTWFHFLVLVLCKQNAHFSVYVKLI